MMTFNRRSFLAGAVLLAGSAACAAETATPETLRAKYEAVTNATGCVLELAAGRYRLTKPMVFTHGVTVRGAADGETVLDGGDALDRLVEIVHRGSDTFVFERLTFTHAAKQALAKGHVTYHGRGTLVVRDCRFIANGTKWNAGYGTAGRGLYTSCASVTWGATTLVERCTFEGNAYRPADKDGKGGKGGAVVVSGQMRTQFTDCTFKQNGLVAPKDNEPCLSAVMSGAAAYVTGSPAEFVRCRFVGNCAVSQGEGGWMYDGATLALENSQKAVPWNCAVKDCVFEGNRTLAPGPWNRYSPTVGALFVSDSTGFGAVSVTGCTFAGNCADTVVGSAGISVFGGNLELRDSRFRDNAVAAGGKGADLHLVGQFAFVPARPTRATVADCAFASEGDDRVFARGGARLSLGKPDAPNGVLKVSDAGLLARLPKLDLAGVRKIVLDGKLATAGSEMPIRADGKTLVVQGEDGTVVDGLGKGTPLIVESTGSVSFVNLDLAGLGSVWPVRLGAGLTRFERCRSDGAPGVEIAWTAPACVEPNRYIGWPTVCRRKSGELIAVFSGDRTAHVSKDGKVQAVRSTDGGVTWSAPETWVSSVVDDRDSGLVELPNGDLVLFYFSSVCYAGTGYTNDFVSRIGCDYKTAKAAVGAFCRRSADGGKTWGEPSRLRGIAPHGACVTKDGRLVLVSRGQRAEGNVLENDPAWATTTHKLYAEASADGGRSWTLLHEFEVPKGVDVTKIHEPHVVEAADGSLVAQFRTSLFEGVLLQSVSADGGRSWTPLAPTALHGHPAHLVRLADGRLLTTYGRRSGENGGSGVYVAVSSDNGRTWGRELKVSCNAYNVYNFGYPATADLGDGKFLTVCYQQVADNATPCLMAVRWSLGK